MAVPLTVPSSAFCLDDEVARFYADHPDRKKSIFFAEVNRTPRWIFAARTPRAITLGIRDCDLLYTNAMAFKDMGTAGRTFGCAAPDGQPLNFIFLRAAYANGSQFVASTTTGARKSAYTDHDKRYTVFDHAAGHALCTDGMRGRNFSECLAYAYMCLRHIQRFGRDTRFLREYCEHNALLLFADAGRDKSLHFSAPVIAAIIRDSASRDFQKLTSQETIGVAGEYARAYAYPYERRRAMMRGAVITSLDLNGVAQLARAVATTSNPDIAEWGEKALSALASDRFRLARQEGPVQRRPRPQQASAYAQRRP